MPDLPAAHSLHRKGSWTGAYDLVVLAYDERFLRRKRLVTAQGEGFLVSLIETVSVDHGDAFKLVDGRMIENLHVDNARRVLATAAAIAAL